MGELRFRDVNLLKFKKVYVNTGWSKSCSPPQPPLRALSGQRPMDGEQGKVLICHQLIRVRGAGREHHHQALPSPDPQPPLQESPRTLEGWREMSSFWFSLVFHPLPLSSSSHSSTFSQCPLGPSLREGTSLMLLAPAFRCQAPQI